MIASAVDKVRNEPGKGFVTIFGVVLIVSLLWAIGHVAQGQVRQAQARGEGQERQQAMALRCAAEGSGRGTPGCTTQGTWPTDAQSTSSGRAVYVSYR